MGLPPALWFGAKEGDRAADAGLVAALEDETLRAVLEEVIRLGKRDGRLLPGIARWVSPSPEGPAKATNKEGG